MLMDHNDKGEKRKGNQDFFTAEDTGGTEEKMLHKRMDYCCYFHPLPVEQLSG